MEMILREVEQALSARLYYLAITMTFALPDICAALESADGATNPDRYRAWYDANLAVQYPVITAQDCYCWRCGVLHQGRFGHPGSQYSRIVFTMPNAKRVSIHGVILSDALNLDADQFCRDVVAAVRAWFAAKGNDSNVRANYPRLVQFRPDGLLPYIKGLPVIA
jgi:hypothetical protein